MLQRIEPKAYIYSGPLADVCKCYVLEKRADGSKFNKEAQKLSEFSRFSIPYVTSEHELPKELVDAWLVKRANEADKNIYYRMTVVKGLAEYMNRMGMKAYIPDKSDIPKMHWHTYVPYIFTHEEIIQFFSALDAMKPSKYSNSHRRNIVMPVVFRLLYCCGLRVNEALSLTFDDVNLNDGILTIREAKFDKYRYVPMSDEMTEVMREYITSIKYDLYFFPSRDGGKYHDKTVYEMFRQVLWAAGISHGGRGKGPRVHDFRHTFSVHCLQKWISNGIPISSALPRLSTYLGHNDIAATERYLRMTAELYPEISEMLSKKLGHVIPKGEDL